MFKYIDKIESKQLYGGWLLLMEGELAPVAAYPSLDDATHTAKKMATHTGKRVIVTQIMRVVEHIVPFPNYIIYDYGNTLFED